ncbi:MAG: hypothetical protein OHK93_001545 [Ramalina farinacea]|uniref:Uncharacterized protein n=1 Tax=Ramalina farinacea TaxID=258253 RepID=A0AA43QPR6_9LECA|nr:hypothetical protein [Ramalina farinacea]
MAVHLSQLEPGGHFELEEIDFKPQCDDGTLSPRGAITIWWRALSRATVDLGFPLALDPAMLKSLLEKAEFEDIKVEATKLAIGSDRRRCTAYYDPAQPVSAQKSCSECTFWPRDEKEQALGDLYLNALADDNCHSLDSLSNAAFFALPSCLPESWHTFKAQVRDEMQNTSVHVYNTL